MEEIKKVYRKKADEFSEHVEVTGSRLFLLSMLRLFVFIAGLALLVMLWNISQILAVASFIAVLLIFAFLLKKYAQLNFLKSFYSNLLTINRNELQALNNDYSCFESGKEFIDPQHDFSHDIDLFGDRSVYQFLNRTCTGRGKELLAEWLAGPTHLSNDMVYRQSAVRELAGFIDWRQEFMAYGMAGGTERPVIEDINDWLKEKPKYLGNKTYNMLRFMMPGITLVLFGLTLAGMAHYSFFVMLVLINLFIISLNLKTINRNHAKVSKKHGQLRNIVKLIAHFEEQDFKSECMNDLQDTMTDDKYKASESFRKLSNIIQSFDSRLNMLLAIPLNGLLLWDIQCVHSIERWKTGMGKSVPVWFEKLGYADALCSLATFAANNPGFDYPEFAEGEKYMEASSMGHPLIPFETRVDNDFEISKKGEISIITGANMAGKSTFLRTVTVNLILAMAGAPVCAREFRFTPCIIFSSMRTTDSLSDKESYFYAELKRLGILKERLERKENIFFLLDEILKGTNSKDKSEGSRLFIKKLTEYEATGIIATHDIVLGSLADEYESVRNRCFEIEIKGDEVKFDYILREGLTTKMNAALLMRQMGIV